VIRQITHKFFRKLFFLSTRWRIFRYNFFSKISKKHKHVISDKSLISSLSVKSKNAKANRAIATKLNDNKWKELIITCYVTNKPDPQTGIVRSNSNFEFIQPWYDSMVRVGLPGIILHDGLTSEFIEKYETDNIQFRYCTLGNYSIFEERWLLYHLILLELPRLERVFFTDSNDVFVTRNPFAHVEDKLTLFVGRDQANRIKDSGWLKEECDKFTAETGYKIPKTYPYQWAYNAGVCGGSVEVMRFFTSEMAKLILLSKSNFHKDMTLLNLVIHQHFFPKLSSTHWEQKYVDTTKDGLASHTYLVTGFPFNSGFKDFDYASTATFIHK